MKKEMELYGPLAFLIGKWSSGSISTGLNRAPSPDRGVENTKFRQETVFEPIGDVENHEQLLYALRYSTLVWEEGDDETFHEEVGYWIWDKENKQVMKSFIVPRGVSVQAGGTVESHTQRFSLEADLGSETYGICSNKFLDIEFKTIRYELVINKIDENTFSYEEDTHLKIKGQDNIFHHTESNVMKRI
jgi:hypothetical protein